MTEETSLNAPAYRVAFKCIAAKCKSFRQYWASFIVLSCLVISVVALVVIFYAIKELECRVNESSDYWPFDRIKQYQPRHVHLSYGENPEDIVVTWSTADDPGGSFVRFGKISLEERVATGTLEKFTTSGTCGRTQYIHRVNLTNLEPGERYVYHCGGQLGWSPTFSFLAMRNGSDWSPTVAIFGDLGAENAMSLSLLQREAQQGEYDAILHIGDFAYNLESEGGLVGDVFMDGIQSIAAYVPYMTCPGNHENDDNQNFREYKHRFQMPGNKDVMFHSWNMGPVHFVSINSEVYFASSFEDACEQYNWLHDDLKFASSPDVRKERPWIIIYAHRPMYCTNTDTPCLENNNRLRIGVPGTSVPGLEELLVRYGVDLAIWAHVHSYERLFPLYNTTVHNGSLTEPYNNPEAPTHIITGSAGCKWEHDSFPELQPPWSAFRTLDYGYGRLRVINTTHLYFEQVSIDKNNTVVDSFTLVRTKHDSYPSINLSHVEDVCIAGAATLHILYGLTLFLIIVLYTLTEVEMIFIPE